MREITRPGEISRAELQMLCEKHLTPALEALKKAGIEVAVIAAPSVDPPDGKAVVASTTNKNEEISLMFAHALKQVITKKTFDLTKGQA